MIMRGSCAMRENHDMNRLASDPGMTPEKLRTAAALNVLLAGTPILYYGQEIGMRGALRDDYKTDEKDIGNREAFEWEAKVESPIMPTGTATRATSGPKNSRATMTASRSPSRMTIRIRC